MPETNTERKVTKAIIEAYIQYFVERQGRFTVNELWTQLKGHGFSFGDTDELATEQELQRLRGMIGRIVDPTTGKRKYINTKEQLELDFGEPFYCPAHEVKSESDEEKQSLNWIKNHIVSIIMRTPLLPQWAVDEIVTSIERVFEKMRKVA